MYIMCKCRTYVYTQTCYTYTLVLCKCWRHNVTEGGRQRSIHDCQGHAHFLPPVFNPVLTVFHTVVDYLAKPSPRRLSFLLRIFHHSLLLESSVVSNVLPLGVAAGASLRSGGRREPRGRVQTPHEGPSRGTEGEVCGLLARQG